MVSGRHIKFLSLLVLPIASAWLGTAIGRTSLGEWIELRSYDLRFRLRGPLLPRSRPGIVLVLVDEGTFRRISDPLVLWQRYFARVVSELVRCRAATIGLDFVFPDTTRVDPEGQQALVETLLQAQGDGVPTVLAYGARAGGSDTPSPLLLMALGPSGFAYANLTTDPDDFVRRQELTGLTDDGDIRPGFAYAIASSASASSRSAANRLQDTEGTILINYRGPDVFPTIPFWKVLEAATSDDDEEIREMIEGKVVLVGMGTEEDLHATPLYFWPSPAAARDASDLSGYRRTLGIAIHAHVLSTLLEGPSLRRASAWQELGLAFLAGLSAAAAALFLSFPLALAGVLMATGVESLLVMQWSFSNGSVLQLVPPTVSLGAAFLLAQGLRYSLEGREKRKLKRLFQRYVSPDVVRQLVQRPEKLALEGEHRTVSVLFSDIRDFTTRSEQTPPEILVLCLNRYLSVMVEIIHRHGGMVDKFIGDAIMAVFGAPLTLEDHARRAVEAGCAMQSALKVLNEKFTSEGIPELTIGVGIHSGEAIVGNIGSPERMEYTVIGDTVNVAARIESLCKRFGPSILISSATRLGVDAPFVFESLGEELLKGKTEPVSIYRVIDAGQNRSQVIGKME